MAAAALAAALAASASAERPSPDSQPGAGSPEFVPDEVVVGLRSGGERVLRLPPGVAPGRAISRLADRPGIDYANRNWIVGAAIDPLDRGRSGDVGGWRRDQWNFLGRPGGVRVQRAWRRLANAGRPGGAGVTVAVVDTGVAYTGPPPSGFAPSPDLASKQSIPGPDFVDGGPPLDENGHGTHVAGTIVGEVTLDEPAPAGVPDLTGLAYNARLMPVRVLDRTGYGTSANVARAVRWAARNGADVINLSLQLPNEVRSCEQVRMVCRATRMARRLGTLVVAAAGNVGAGKRGRVPFPAAAPGVVAVGASTAGGCLAAYSHHGRRLDLLAPGGGRPFQRTVRRPCRGDREPVRQVSFDCFSGRRCLTHDRFEIKAHSGTSMAAAHVSGVAALLLARRSKAGKLAPQRLRDHLRCTARPRGQPRFHGAGLLDAARATSRQSPPRCRP